MGPQLTPLGLSSLRAAAGRKKKKTGVRAVHLHVPCLRPS